MTAQAAEGARDKGLEAFLAKLEAALVDRTGDAEAEAVLQTVLSALRTPAPADRPEARRLSVCAYLAQATQTARAHSSAVAEVVDAFVGLEPSLRWATRSTGGASASVNWPDGHANATIVSRGGLEARDDVQIGVSVMAPRVRYPDHRHAPEEVYLVLSRGRFKHGPSSWVEPGIGGAFHNTPNIEHAMASDAAPLLAIWCLWSGRSRCT
jgi:hypothetical protein